jgi:hypothetical protein
MGFFFNKIIAQPLDDFHCAAKIISDYRVPHMDQNRTFEYFPANYLKRPGSE